ncbi:MAG: flagellar hook-associated protein FlgK [Gemmobacter sp.]|uniref:flagellar hook-associated protein FlgK n=1 Tax=Gemmobacter sp. TaxID=1898957 RepID=UPI001A59DB71|nr:flagellar hook-associated protein FlgK [Gemmobacter sp.]MBL8562720.1 flagellar hook-associated protein FlgK [Gemmobacter sp.]
MSLISAMNSAISGLAVSSRLADLTSTNIANAATPGYLRRQADVSSAVLGGEGAGVTINGIRRDLSLYLQNERRGAEASVSNQDARATFLARVETSLGTDSENSLMGRIAAFDTALIAAASRPESDARLSTVLTSARQVIDHIGTTAKSIQTARTEADSAIAAEVDVLNSALAQVEELNGRIVAANIAGRDSTGLQDLRQRQIDQIAGIIPLREIPRENGMIALYSTNGSPLLEGKASEFGFSATRGITADMTLSGGQLSGLTMNGRDMSTEANGLLAGGSLSAHFAVRDELAPAAQAKLDGLSRDLVERFQASGLDSTLPSGAAGLFTDGGAAFVSTDEVGLSARLQINAAADPEQGGALWRLRDGLGAATTGSVGDSTFINRLRGALTAETTPASGALDSGPRSLAALASDITSRAARDRVTVEDQLTFAQSRATTLQEQEQVHGVDTDQELQNLLLIEQSYAANARVIQTIDDMLATLMEL